MVIRVKMYPVGKPGSDTYRVVQFAIGDKVKTLTEGKYTGMVTGLGRLYITVVCNDGEGRAFYPHQLEKS